MALHHDAPAASRGRRRLIAGLAAVAAVGLALSACSSATPEPTADSFGEAGIALSWIKNYEFAGYFAADQNGYFTDAGFDSVNLIAGGGETSPWDTVLAGNATIGLASDLLGPASAIQQGADLVIIGAQYVESPVGIVSLAGNPISSVDDLVGKTFGVDAGGLAIIKAILAANGLPEDAVTFESVPNGIDPLMNGSVDALVGFLTNYPIAVADAGGDPVVLTLSDAGFSQVGDAVVTTRANLENHRDEVKALLTAVIRGWNDVLADDSLAVSLALKYGADNDLDPTLQAASAAVQPSFILTKDTVENGIFTITDSLAEKAVASLAGLGITGLTTSDLFDSSLLAEVYAENPDLIPGFTVPAAN